MVLPRTTTKKQLAGGRFFPSPCSQKRKQHHRYTSLPFSGAPPASLKANKNRAAAGDSPSLSLSLSPPRRPSRTGQVWLLSNMSLPPQEESQQVGSRLVLLRSAPPAAAMSPRLLRLLRLRWFALVLLAALWRPPCGNNNHHHVLALSANRTPPKKFPEIPSSPLSLQNVWSRILPPLPTAKGVNLKRPEQRSTKKGKGAVTKTAIVSGEALLQQLNLTASTVPRRFAVSRLQQIPTLVRASLPPLFRGGSGPFALDYRAKFVPRNNNKSSSYTVWATKDWQVEESSGFFVPMPSTPLILYDDLSDPSCQLIREACSMLSLPVTMKPSPSNGRRQTFRKELQVKYGATAIPPFLVDPTTSATLASVDDALSYLFQVYGNGFGNIPAALRPGWFRTVSSTVGAFLAKWGSGPNLPRGFASNPPPMSSSSSSYSAEPLFLTLWAYEGSPFCRVVRETLEVLEVPHIVLHCPRGSLVRQELFQQAGFFQVPCLDDPFTNIRLWESDAIVEYLLKQYGVSPSPVNYL